MANRFMYHVQKALYGGIRNDVPGHGGDECANYLDRNLMYLDTGIATVLMIVTFIFALKTCTMPRLKDINTAEPASKSFMLMLICIVFGIEIGYKLASEQALYLLNPCHVLTIAEIYLLAVKPSRNSVIVLRLLIHYLYGALIAMLLPDLHARKLYGELFTYWFQHFLIYFVIPPYIVYQWGIQSLEPLKDIAWACFTGSIMGIHHLYIMQPLALLTRVNLNFVMCPSTGDPFNGPYYRIAAVGHQTICLLFSGKLYTIALRMFLPKRNIKKD